MGGTPGTSTSLIHSHLGRVGWGWLGYAVCRSSAKQDSDKKTSTPKSHFIFIFFITKNNFDIGIKISLIILSLPFLGGLYRKSLVSPWFSAGSSRTCPAAPRPAALPPLLQSGPPLRCAAGGRRERPRESGSGLGPAAAATLLGLHDFGRLANRQHEKTMEKTMGTGSLFENFDD